MISPLRIASRPGMFWFLGSPDMSCAITASCRSVTCNKAAASCAIVRHAIIRTKNRNKNDLCSTFRYDIFGSCVNYVCFQAMNIPLTGHDAAEMAKRPLLHHHPKRLSLQLGSREHAATAGKMISELFRAPRHHTIKCNQYQVRMKYQRDILKDWPAYWDAATHINESDNGAPFTLHEFRLEITVDFSYVRTVAPDKKDRE